MSVEENREKLRRLLEEVSSSGNYDLLDEYVHEDVVLPPGMPEGAGREGLKAALAAYDHVIEYRDVVEDAIAEGDKVAVRVVNHGKLNGEFLGLHGNGQEYTIDEMMIAQFRDGKISRIWRVADLFSLLRQVGATAQVTR
jgi:ketosteroid isomerase-like protein